MANARVFGASPESRQRGCREGFGKCPENQGAPLCSNSSCGSLRSTAASSCSSPVTLRGSCGVPLSFVPGRLWLAAMGVPPLHATANAAALGFQGDADASHARRRAAELALRQVALGGRMLR
eukprot:TRINITY_DN11280_c0_g3_i3.p2 TRINITY_DN11280_c0_g3~~TRINITY_DN11280_c0_g3_i3.p2  ORF type:complete len:122 (-),score=23.37 TRINITY_DN11280_c0_g3_i3:300-665(-)